MKTTFLSIIAGLLITGNTIAGPDTNCAAKSYPEEIKYLMSNCISFFDADLNGRVHIAFIVDEENKIQIQDVESKNIFLENYTMCALQDAEIETECLNPGELFEINIVFNDTNYQ